MADPASDEYPADKALIAASRKGDLAAFERLYRRHKRFRAPRHPTVQVILSQQRRHRDEQATNHHHC